MQLKMKPPNIPVKMKLEGKKFRVTNAQFQGGSFIFSLTSKETHDEYTVEISGLELFDFKRLMRKARESGNSHRYITYKRPLVKQQKYIKRLEPAQIEIRKTGAKAPYLKCSSGFGLTMKFRDYHTFKTNEYQKVEAVSNGKIFLRLPDKYKSYLEGYFRLKIK